MKKLRDSTLIISPDYLQFIEDLKARVVSARVTAARAITHEAILLYWDIGRAIVEKQKLHAWGESAIDQVSVDLLNAFPGTTGYSPRNLRSARQLYLTYSDPAIWLQPVAKMAKQPGASAIWLQPVAKLTPEAAIEFLRQLVAEIPWGQNLLILNKLTKPAARLWYLRATARFGWSRNVLLNQIKGGAYERAVTDKKTHNFADFYLNLLNDKERGPDDQPAIGIILCAEKDDVEVEYALRSKANPIGVATYQLQPDLPAELKGKLPTAKQLANLVRVEMGGGK